MEPDRVDTLKFAIAVSGALLLLWEARLRDSGRQAVQRRLRNGLLVALGVAAGFAWPNLFEYRYGSYLHGHDLFHYYVGSKYLPELGYTRLYECTALADARAGHRSSSGRRRSRCPAFDPARDSADADRPLRGVATPAPPPGAPT